MHRIYLIPGFFGFTNLGELQYFGHVLRFLRAEAARLGVEAEVHVVQTLPTASLRRRAARVHETIVATARPEDVLHLVGHSSGGIDARLLATPGVSLPGDVEVEDVASRIRSVVTVASPHHGTPSAEFFSTLYGKKLLKLLSLATVYVVRWGRLPLGLVLRIAGVFRLALQRRSGSEMADELFETLLGEFSRERRDAVKAFFSEVGEDQGLLRQITPDAMDSFNATTRDRPGVRYGCVVTRAATPGMRSAWRAGVNPNAQAAHALYLSCYRLAAGMTPGHAPPLGPEEEAHYQTALGEVPTLAANDAMVPTLSQRWGSPIRVVQADHLDVIGHFAGRELDPPQYDWIPTGSRYRRPHFEATWIDVLHFLLDPEPGPRGP